MKLEVFRIFFSILARRCFVKNANNNGSLHNSGFFVLEEWYEFVNEFHPIRCDLIIYLKTTPEIAYNRVLERAREEESKLDIDYLRQLHKCHEDLLINSRLEIPMIVVDANKNFDEIKEEYQRCLTEIKAQQNREAAKPWRDAILKI
jgi:deoxynucleoside kinase